MEAQHLYRVCVYFISPRHTCTYIDWCVISTTTAFLATLVLDSRHIIRLRLRRGKSQLQHPGVLMLSHRLHAMLLIYLFTFSFFTQIQSKSDLIEVSTDDLKYVVFHPLISYLPKLLSEMIYVLLFLRCKSKFLRTEVNKMLIPAIIRDMYPANT